MIHDHQAAFAGVGPGLCPLLRRCGLTGCRLPGFGGCVRIVHIIVLSGERAPDYSPDATPSCARWQVGPRTGGLSCVSPEPGILCALGAAPKTQRLAGGRAQHPTEVPWELLPQPAGEILPESSHARAARGMSLAALVRGRALVSGPPWPCSRVSDVRDRLRPILKCRRTSASGTVCRLALQATVGSQSLHTVIR